MFIIEELPINHRKRIAACNKKIMSQKMKETIELLRKLFHDYYVNFGFFNFIHFAKDRERIKKYIQAQQADLPAGAGLDDLLALVDNDEHIAIADELLKQEPGFKSKKIEYVSRENHANLPEKFRASIEEELRKILGDILLPHIKNKEKLAAEQTYISLNNYAPDKVEKLFSSQRRVLSRIISENLLLSKQGAHPIKKLKSLFCSGYVEDREISTQQFVYVLYVNNEYYVQVAASERLYRITKDEFRVLSDVINSARVKDFLKQKNINAAINFIERETGFTPVLSAELKTGITFCSKKQEVSAKIEKIALTIHAREVKFERADFYEACKAVKKERVAYQQFKATIIGKPISDIKIKEVKSGFYDEKIRKTKRELFDLNRSMLALKFKLKGLDEIYFAAGQERDSKSSQAEVLTNHLAFISIMMDDFKIDIKRSVGNEKLKQLKAVNAIYESIVKEYQNSFRFYILKASANNGYYNKYRLDLNTNPFFSIEFCFDYIKAVKKFYDALLACLTTFRVGSFKDMLAKATGKIASLWGGKGLFHDEVQFQDNLLGFVGQLATYFESSMTHHCAILEKSDSYFGVCKERIYLISKINELDRQIVMAEQKMIELQYAKDTSCLISSETPGAGKSMIEPKHTTNIPNTDSTLNLRF